MWWRFCLVFGGVFWVLVFIVCLFGFFVGLFLVFWGGVCLFVCGFFSFF